MDETELEDLYELYGYENKFDRYKKIFELTNDLDLFLLIHLKNRCKKHFLDIGLDAVKHFLVQEHTEDYIDEKHEEYFENFPGDCPEKITLFQKSCNILIDYFGEDKKRVDKNTLIKDRLRGNISVCEYWALEQTRGQSEEFLDDIDRFIEFSKCSLNEKNITKEFEDSKSSNSKSSDSNNDKKNVSNSIPKKIAFLDKLGIIKLLKSKEPFKSTPSLLAKAFCEFMDERDDSIQPVLSAFFSGNTKNGNHPYYSKKTEPFVLDKLKEIGYKPE